MPGSYYNNPASSLYEKDKEKAHLQKRNGRYGMLVLRVGLEPTILRLTSEHACTEILLVVWRINDCYWQAGMLK